MSEGLVYCISPVLYRDGNTGYSYRQGTSFYTKYGERLFAITASHCIDGHDVNNLFLGLNPSKKHNYNIPLNKQIKLNYTNGAMIDSDVRIFEIDQLSLMKNLAKRTTIRSKEDMIKEIINTPLVQKLLKKYRNQPEKFRKALLKTTLFKTMYGRLQEEILKSLENADTSLAEVKTLELIKDICPQENQTFIGIGFPIGLSGDKLKMTDDGKVTGWHFSYSEFELVYIGSQSQYNDYIFSYDNSLDLNGVSGGPVVDSSNKVIGVLSWIEKEKGLVYVTPSMKIIDAIDTVVKNTFDDFIITSEIEKELLDLIYRKN